MEEVQPVPDHQEAEVKPSKLGKLKPGQQRQYGAGGSDKHDGWLGTGYEAGRRVH